MIRFLSQINRLKDGIDLTVKIGHPPLSQETKDRITMFSYSFSPDKLRQDYPEAWKEFSLKILEVTKGMKVEDLAIAYSTELAKLVSEKLGADVLKKLIEKIEKAVEEYYG